MKSGDRELDGPTVEMPTGSAGPSEPSAGADSDDLPPTVPASEALGQRRRLDELLDRALELEGDQRLRFLAEDCPADLRPELERLLELGEKGSTHEVERRWPDLLHEVAEAASASGEPLVPGRELGPWRLVDTLGQGGMGTVFLAERCDGQFEMRAALKISHRPRHDRSSRERFERERQIVARLEHPSIARILDGGVTEDGRPYFVMELVDGEPIDTFCDRRRLSVEERLQLFLRLVRAVEVAHSHLVVHRDLKPSNILVTAEGEPKLLDFGIAKLLEDGVEGEAGTRLLTPEYAAPEQFLGKPVSLATDVYLLGLLLYELLTGVQPQRSGGDSASRLLVRVCQEMPPLPSQQLQSGTGPELTSSEGDTGPEALTTPVTRAADRGTSPARLARRLEGDLDTIVAKALAKEAERRYRSVGEMADDVERYLGGLPISARPDTIWYRGGKFVRRNAAAVATTLGMLLLIAGLLVLHTRSLAKERNQALEARAQAEAARSVAERAREEAEAVAQFLAQLFDAADPRRTNGREVSARQLLETGRDQARAAFSERPLVRARLLNVIGRVTSRLGSHDDGAPLIHEALELRRQELGPDHPDVAEFAYHAGVVDKLRGEYDEAIGHYRAAQRLLEATMPGGTAEQRNMLSAVYSSYANLLGRRGYLDEAEQTFGRALALFEDDPNPKYEFYDGVLVNLGLLYLDQGRFEEAEELFLRSLELTEEHYGPDHIELDYSLNNLGIVAIQAGDPEKALEWFGRALEIRRRALGPEGEDVAGGLTNVAIAMTLLGRYQEAEGTFHRALRMLDSTVGPGHPRSISTHEGLARLYREIGDGEATEQHARRSIELRERTQAERHPSYAFAHVTLGHGLSLQGRDAAAEDAFRHALQLFEKHVDPEHPHQGRARQAYGRFLAERGREGREMWRQGVDLLERALGAEHPSVVKARRSFESFAGSAGGVSGGADGGEE